MMITKINYSPMGKAGIQILAKAQTQNFAGITVSPLLKNLCELSDYDIKSLNNRCPKGLDIYAKDSKAYGYPNARIATVTAKCNGESAPGSIFDVYTFDWAKNENNFRLIHGINNCIRYYNENYANNNQK